uniref:Uncharacterized protein n=1 Tax=Sphaerodactylus townsendi TaxID=933632 RepID=A0ACB8EVJ2_9SAUR
MTVQYIQYKGIKFPPGYNSVHSLCFAENKFEVRDDDIFNVTYPKSGTCVMTEIPSLIPQWGESNLESECSQLSHEILCSVTTAGP